MENEKFHERKFRAAKYGRGIECDKCGCDIDRNSWAFVRRQGYYGEKSELTGKRIKHIERKTVLCGSCVNSDKVRKKDREVLG